MIKRLPLLYTMMVIRMVSQIIREKEELYKRRTRAGFVFQTKYGRPDLNELMCNYAKEIFSDIAPEHHSIAIMSYAGMRKFRTGVTQDCDVLHIHIPFGIYFKLLNKKDEVKKYLEKEYILAKLMSEGG
jgi:hypothetical protein